MVLEVESVLTIEVFRTSLLTTWSPLSKSWVPRWTITVAISRHKIVTWSQVNPTEAQLEACSELARFFFNFTVTLDDFAALMESAENYRYKVSRRRMCVMMTQKQCFWASSWIESQGHFIEHELFQPNSLPFLSRLALHQKKISSLLEKLLKREVTFGVAEKDLVDEAFCVMEKLKGEVARSLSCLFRLFISHLFEVF